LGSSFLFFVFYFYFIFIILVLNVIIETRDIKSLFKERAYRIPISANKSMLGHLIGAAGAASAAIAVLTIGKGIIPPTINQETQDPECDLDYVPNLAGRKKVRNVLANSFGFGRHNTSLIFKMFDQNQSIKYLVQEIK
jgi:3-oxoacyl-[acyl-carrier-protein] synthase II